MTTPIRILFFKSQISAYTDKNGRFVPAHTDKRTKSVSNGALLYHPASNSMRAPKALPSSDRRTINVVVTDGRLAHLRDPINGVRSPYMIDSHPKENIAWLRAIGHTVNVLNEDGSDHQVNVETRSGSLRVTDVGTLSKAMPVLFLKSHVKQFTRKDGTIVKEHDDKRTKRAEAAPVARPVAQPEEVKQAPAKNEAAGGNAHNTEPKDAEDVRGSAHGYGTHNIEEGDTIHFKAGEFSGGGKVKAIGKDGATVTDASGREHNVHWHEVTGFKANRGDGGGKKPPGENGKPVAEGEEPPKKDETKKPTILGKQEPIPAESFNAADYAKSHDQSDVSAESIIAEFPADTKEKVAMAVDRVANIEETLRKFQNNGEWTIERQELHRKILYDGITNSEGKKIPGLLSPERVAAARPPKGVQPTFIILGGRGGSGKSSFEGEVYEPEQCIVLDADHIKSMLPEYEGWNAAQVHDESGDLFDHVAGFARIMGLNVVLDKTMKTAKSAIADVEKFKKAGYRTEAHYMHLPRQVAAQRAVKRFLDGGKNGRFVPPEIVLANTTNEAAFDQVSKMVDAWSFRDNNVPKGSKPILISQKGEPTMKRKEILRKSLGKRIILTRRIEK